VADPQYLYQPIYGVAPWEAVEGKSFADAAGTIPDPTGPFGGGAVVSPDNLILTAWTVTDTDAEDHPSQGALLRPFNEFPSNIAQDAQFGFAGVSLNGLAQEFDSRTAARFVLSLPTAPTPQAFEPPVLLVLNPPSGLKNRLARAISIEGRGGPMGFTGTVNKSLWDVAVWACSFMRGASGIDQGVMGEYVPGSALRGLLPFTGVTGLPLLRTSGADGNYPEFLPVYPDSNTVPALVEALDSGDFYVPMLIAWDTEVTPNVTFDCAWPHSVARGS
jgi:hypothetical protein